MSAISSDSEARIIIVGKVGSGKTSIIENLMNKPHSYAHRPTVGSELYEAEILEKCTQSRFHVFIWDTSGDEMYDAICRFYYKGSTCAIVTCDQEDLVSNLQESVTCYLKRIHEECGRIPMIIAVTKSDQLHSRIDSRSDRSFPFEDVFIPIIYTSGRDGSNVAHLFNQLLLDVVRHHQLVGTRMDTPIHKPQDLKIHE